MGGHFLSGTLQTISPSRLALTRFGGIEAHYDARNGSGRTAVAVCGADGELAVGYFDRDPGGSWVRGIERLDTSVMYSIREWVSGGGRG